MPETLVFLGEMAPSAVVPVGWVPVVVVAPGRPEFAAFELPRPEEFVFVVPGVVFPTPDVVLVPSPARPSLLPYKSSSSCLAPGLLYWISTSHCSDFENTYRKFLIFSIIAYDRVSFEVLL